LTISNRQHLCLNWYLADTSNRFPQTLLLARTTLGGSRNQASIAKFTAVQTSSAAKARRTVRGKGIVDVINAIAFIEGF
jgi:hypothetical protein